jgi:hypothetical protein
MDELPTTRQTTQKPPWCRFLTVKTIAAIVLGCWSVAAVAQISIRVPRSRYKSHEMIEVEIVDTGDADVTYCVEYGQVSFIDPDHSGPTPTPLYVQQKTSRGWNTLLNGPDVGSSRRPETLHSGESQHFPFRVNAHGTVRIVLEYRLGPDENFCTDETGKRVVTSREISIE